MIWFNNTLFISSYSWVALQPQARHTCPGAAPTWMRTESWLTVVGNSICLVVNSSTEMLRSRSEWYRAGHTCKHGYSTIAFVSAQTYFSGSENMVFSMRSGLNMVLGAWIFNPLFLRLTLTHFHVFSMAGYPGESFVGFQWGASSCRIPRRCLRCEVWGLAPVYHLPTPTLPLPPGINCTFPPASDTTFPLPTSCSLELGQGWCPGLGASKVSPAQPS